LGSSNKTVCDHWFKYVSHALRSSSLTVQSNWYNWFIKRYLALENMCNRKNAITSRQHLPKSKRCIVRCTVCTVMHTRSYGLRSSFVLVVLKTKNVAFERRWLSGTHFAPRRLPRELSYYSNAFRFRVSRVYTTDVRVQHTVLLCTSDIYRVSKNKIKSNRDWDFAGPCDGNETIKTVAD
jgi:hypothetical protein